MLQICPILLRSRFIINSTQKYLPMKTDLSKRVYLSFFLVGLSSSDKISTLESFFASLLDSLSSLLGS